LSGYTFTPNNRPLSNVTTDQPNQDFVAKTVGIAGAYGIRPIQIYPNPTTGQLIINNEQLTIKNVEIYDVVGKKLVSQFTFHDSHIEIDISHLANGLYFLKIDGKVFKVIKN